jgi:hypothetical protein
MGRYNLLHFTEAKLVSGEAKILTRGCPTGEQRLPPAGRLPDLPIALYWLVRHPLFPDLVLRVVGSYVLCTQHLAWDLAQAVLWQEELRAESLGLRVRGRETNVPCLGQPVLDIWEKCRTYKAPVHIPALPWGAVCTLLRTSLLCYR